MRDFKGITLKLIEKALLANRKISHEVKLSEQIQLFFSNDKKAVTIRFSVTGATQSYHLDTDEVEQISKEFSNFLIEFDGDS